MEGYAMTTPERLTSLQFSLFVAVLFGVTLLLVALLFGCTSKTGDDLKKPTVTMENLQTAYAKSIMRQQLYSRFGQRAAQEHNTNVAALYQAVARSEEIHAALHANLLRTLGGEAVMPARESVAVGTTLQTLKMSISNEQLEAESMYPNVMRTAELENLPDAVEQFRKAKEADARHLELFKDAYDRGGKIHKVPYFVCSSCGYILTSGHTERCPVCKADKTAFIAM